MPSRPPIDAAIITVIGVEMEAVKSALGINNRERIHDSGVIYFEAKIYSQLHDRELTLIVTCIGEASQAAASARATRVIADYGPALIILVGIAAGMRDKMRIGDVIVPRTVADFRVTEVRADGSVARPVITDCTTPVKQMMANYELNKREYHERCRTLFGPPIRPPAGKEAEYEKHVTFTPKVADNAIATADNLLRSPTAFDPFIAIHPSIRAAEMEAGGLITACNGHHPPSVWMVVRGISDFGDEFKDDEFHRLASCAAAMWVKCFLENGLDIETIRPLAVLPVTVMAHTEPVLAPEVGMGRPGIQLPPVITGLISTQIERLATSNTSDRQRDLEDIREEWRISPGESVVERLRALKTREDWPLIGGEIRAKILRFEASLTLSLSKDVAKAEALRAEALQLDPDLNTEALDALIAFQTDPNVALERLSVPVTPEGWNLRLGILAARGEWTLLFNESENPPGTASPDPETRRLRAIALLHMGRLKDARAELALALEKNAKWFHLRFLDAVLAYFESLSEPLFLATDKNWPEPADPTLVNRDRGTLDNLARAERILKDLVAIPGLDIQLRQEIEGWHLACLGNNPERQNEARTYCSALLEINPTHHVALAWAMARGYATDLTSSIDALFTEFLQS